jgi:hypothetical protein
MVGSHAVIVGSHAVIVGSHAVMVGSHFERRPETKTLTFQDTTNVFVR